MRRGWSLSGKGKGSKEVYDAVSCQRLWNTISSKNMQVHKARDGMIFLMALMFYVQQYGFSGECSKRPNEVERW